MWNLHEGPHMINIGSLLGKWMGELDMDNHKSLGNRAGSKCYKSINVYHVVSDWTLTQTCWIEFQGALQGLQVIHVLICVTVGDVGRGLGYC